MSDEKIELRARECHLAMCWFLGAMGDVESQNLQGEWWKLIPGFSEVAVAVAFAEDKSITVPEALRKLFGRYNGVEFEGACVATWQDEDGRLHSSGPEGEVDVAIERVIFLRDVSEAVGTNVMTVPIDVLNELLSRRHFELAQVALDDGYDEPINQEEYQTEVEACLDEDDPLGLLFVHVMKAKDEERGQKRAIH